METGGGSTRTLSSTNHCLRAHKIRYGGTILTLYSDTSSVGFFYNPGDYGYKNYYALNLAFTTTFTMSGPGPVPDRQDVPHPHFVVADPTGRYLFFPDLGADLIRMYQVTTGSGGTVIQTKALEPFKVVPGSGPRHGAFAKVNGSTFFYTVNELGNSITGYQVTYVSGAAPKLTQILNFSTHGPNGSVPTGTKAAEIVVSVSLPRSLSSGNTH